MQIELTESELTIISASLKANLKQMQIYESEVVKNTGEADMENAYSKMLNLKRKIDNIRTPALL